MGEHIFNPIEYARSAMLARFSPLPVLFTVYDDMAQVDTVYCAFDEIKQQDWLIGTLWFSSTVSDADLFDKLEKAGRDDFSFTSVLIGQSLNAEGGVSMGRHIISCRFSMSLTKAWDELVGVPASYFLFPKRRKKVA